MVEGGDAAVVPAHISGLQETRAVNDESSRSVTITVHREGPKEPPPPGEHLLALSQLIYSNVMLNGCLKS